MILIVFSDPEINCVNLLNASKTFDLYIILSSIHLNLWLVIGCFDRKQDVNDKKIDVTHHKRHALLSELPDVR